MHPILRLLIISSNLMLFVSCSATQSRNKSFLSDYSGFTQESKLRDAISYRGDLQKLDQYDKVLLEEVKIIPPENMEALEITNQELARLQQSFRSALAKEIQESSYALADGAGEGTLSLRAAVTELQPGNPALFSAGYIPYVSTAISATKAATGTKAGAGAAVIEAELLDSQTRERFYAVIDEQAGNKLNLKSGMSRWGHVELAFRQWAARIRKTISSE